MDEVFALGRKLANMEHHAGLYILIPKQVVKHGPPFCFSTGIQKSDSCWLPRTGCPEERGVTNMRVNDNGWNEPRIGMKSRKRISNPASSGW
jgi:hypothetical protein